MTCNLLIVSSFFLVLFLGCNSKKKQSDSKDWSAYLGGADRNHYSSLTQINTSNVNQLKLVWTYHSGDFGEIQCNPLIIKGVLYGTTAACELFALDAGSGKEKWRYVPEQSKNFLKSRGVSYWESGEDRRILYTYDEWLYAIDANSGKPIQSFGNSGRVNLKTGLDKAASAKYVMSRTPGTIYKDLIIMPLAVGEGYGAASGYVESFNIRTGKLAWVFRTIPNPEEEGSDTWPENLDKEQLIGGANSWAGMALDIERGIVFVPTGSAAFDFYGGKRKGQNLFANTLLALNAETGEKIWHYQFVHHDIWDRDLPAPPNLVSLIKDGMQIDAVAQVTKTGHVFVFDRETGVPMFPIQEQEFPQSVIPGESAWPTQPIPVLPKPFSRLILTKQDINPLSSDYDSMLTVYRDAQKGLYQPLSEKPTILFPGCDGGAEWGGAAVDPSGVIYINSNEMAWIFSLSRMNQNQSLLSPGEKTYQTFCATCHKQDLSGNPKSGFPSLIDVGTRVKKGDLSNIISKGRGMMPGFPQVSGIQKQALIEYLNNEEKLESTEASLNQTIKESVEWKFDGYNKFLDSEGRPAITPPWGRLTAIDLNTGQQVWQRILGETKNAQTEDYELTGTENYGGPVVTASGLLFIGATKDGKLRAFDTRNGKLLWETELPAAAFATPSTYEVEGKQYLVIACGGTKLGTKKGDSYVAFALP